MPFLAFCNDNPGSESLRREHLEEHLAYIEKIMPQVCVAGPLRDAPEQPVTGSCFIYHTEQRTVAERLLHDDPYYRAGIYADVTWRHLLAAAGEWVGGKTW